MNEKKCYYCETNPGIKPENKYLWNGFLDKDTNQLVCFGCRQKHYIEKSKTKYKGLYTEFPVYADV